MFNEIMMIVYIFIGISNYFLVPNIPNIKEPSCNYDISCPYTYQENASKNNSTIIEESGFNTNIIATQMSGFSIIFSPTNIKPGKNIDMTIKAIKADGSTVTDYTGTIVMDFGKEGMDTTTYDMPYNGFYEFKPEDKGIKIFKEGFKLHRKFKSGIYTIKIFDSERDDIQGMKTITVSKK